MKATTLRTHFCLCSLLWLGTLTLPSPARAQNLVMNPGFETGDLTGWTPAHTGDVRTSVLVFPLGHPSLHSGKAAATISFIGTDVGATPGVGTLSQTLMTVAGKTYTLDFWLSGFDFDHFATGTVPFSVFWGGSLVGGAPFDVSADGSYHHFTFTVTTTGTSTELKFATPTLNSNSISDYRLDDVSVVAKTAAVPEPGALALLLSAGAVGLWRLRRRLEIR